MRKTAWPFGWGRVDDSWEERRRWMALPFPEAEYRARVEKVRELLRREGLDGLIVHGNRADRAAVRYLSNFEDFYGGDTVVVVPLSGEVGLATNAIMHGEPMHSGIQETWIRDARCAPHPRTVVAATTSIFDHAEDLLRARGLAQGRVGVAGEYGWNVLAALQQRFPHAHFPRETKILPRAMAIKSEAEIGMLRRAARAADAALTAVMEGAREGVSEFELSAMANAAMFGCGAEETAFPIALASGPRAGFKHVPPQDRRLQSGDWVYVDLGCRIHGYYSDASRNRVVGPPTRDQRDFSQANLEIVHACIEAIRPGVTVGDIARVADRVARAWQVEPSSTSAATASGRRRTSHPPSRPRAPPRWRKGWSSSSSRCWCGPRSGRRASRTCTPSEGTAASG